MKLEFQGSNGKRHKIGEPKTIKEAYIIMYKFIKNHHYKSYYTRVNFYPDELEFDVGSYNEFFYLNQLCEDWREQLNHLCLERNEKDA